MLNALARRAAVRVKLSHWAVLPFSLAAAGIVSAALLLPQSPFRLQEPVCSGGLVLRDVVTLARELRPELGAAQVAAIVAQTGETICVPPKLPKSIAAKMQVAAQADPRGDLPPGALRLAIERKNAMMGQGVQAKVAGATGTWTPYGRGPLIVNDARYGRVNGLGLVFNSGRVDSLDYDPVNNRLFAVVGTGGVWLSEDLGDSWRSIGDSLPNQSIGAAAWTPAGGGTLVAGGGEPLFLGGGAFDGLGAFWTTDLGQTWNQASGIPDGLLTFQVAVDQANPGIVYIATSRGLFRSADAGRSFTNVALPTSAECAGNTDVTSPCFYANVITDVVVKEPGGTTNVTCATDGCPVLAAAGYQRSNALSYNNGVELAPGNGLYRSDTGAPNTFARLAASGDGASNIGFPPQERIGRVEFGNAIGPQQNHEYVYALVQDAVLLSGGMRTLDAPMLREAGAPAAPTTTFLSGIYVSSDFGATWLRAADTQEIANNPNSGSSFVAAQAIISPGVQAWYNEWIKPDPTRASDGVPTRVLFGLEEVWQNRLTTVAQNGTLQSGNDDYRVIGTYFAGESCQFPVGAGGDAACPNRDPAVGYVTTTHPDQHEGLFVTKPDGGVCVFVGNDGGVYRQCVAAGEEFNNGKWGDGNNKGFNTLLPYHLAVAKDGTVWFGLQDNGSGKIEPDTRKYFENIGGDGFFMAVDPDNSQVAYSERPSADMAVTVDGGVTWTDMPPPAPVTDTAAFSNPFAMDPLDANHLITAGKPVVETLLGPDTTTADWVTVFDLGVNPDNNINRVMTAIDLYGDAAYVGACGNCNRSVRVDLGFQNWLATNVGGSEPPEKGTPKGWHFASANGLPDRYITAIEIDPANPRTVYVTLGGYGAAQYLPPGRYLDPNTNIGTGNVFKSTDAGENFTDISSLLPQAPAQWIILRGDQLLVGTDIGAFGSSDTSGSEWAPLGLGLPSVPVSSMQLHPGNPDLMLASTFGRGVWCYSFSGNTNACEPPPLTVLVAPVQADPGNVEQPAEAPACGTDTTGDYAVNFSYTPPQDGTVPSGFRVQEATVFEELFFDNADETLNGGSNSKWQGTSGWMTQVNPDTGSPAYFVPDTLDQNEILVMKDAVQLSPGGGLLSFDTSQATEPDFDFISVAVSADNGSTFKTFASYSGVFIGQRQVDLTEFAGLSIKVQFRMTSDTNTGLTGTYIENIRIDTNNFSTVADTTAGATAQTLTGRLDGTRHYRIAALANGLVGPYSNTRCVTVTGLGSPLAAPTGSYSIFSGLLPLGSLLVLAGGVLLRRSRRS